ncbi:hypothetical protein HW49_06340 [Porphyromonadaceae bacterium COT-184 OH4590]|nr:hypothetical protein HW49_06340 [Porphyromonadaceae bacterium COT-184 OH4590]
MKKHKIFLIVSLLTIVLLISVATICFFRFLFPTQIEINNKQLDKKETLIILNSSRFLWDTGAESSVLFENFNQRRITVGFANVFDVHKTSTTRKRYFSTYLRIDSILLKNFIYHEIPTEYISQVVQNMNFKGILGMNVIKNYNWLLDFSKNTLNNFNISYKYDNLAIFKLEYKSKHKPCTSLDIEGIKLEKIFIDSGSEADIKLAKKEIEKINRILQPDTTLEYVSSGLLRDSISHKKYIYTNIRINNIILDTLSIVESSKCYIGIGFFRKFDRVFWDSGSKEVRFYRD